MSEDRGAPNIQKEVHALLLEHNFFQYTSTKHNCMHAYAQDTLQYNSINAILQKYQLVH